MIPLDTMDSDIMLKIRISREFARHRGTSVVLIWLLYNERSFNSELQRVWGGSLQAMRNAIEWLLQMKMIAAKDAHHPQIDRYYTLTANGLRVAKILDAYMEEVVKVYTTIPEHPLNKK